MIDGTMQMTTLETDRLIVRNFMVSDWKALHQVIKQYQSSEYAAYDHQWPTSEEEIKKITEWFASGDGYLAVILKDEGQFVGFVSLSRGRNQDTGEMNLGYVFNFDYHGKGFATEACRAVISHAFDQSQVERVVANTAAANHPSCRLLERLGFTRMSESKGSFRTKADGTPIEFVAYTFELSRDEWEAARERRIHLR